MRINEQAEEILLQEVVDFKKIDTSDDHVELASEVYKILNKNIVEFQKKQKKQWAEIEKALRKQKGLNSNDIEEMMDYITSEMLTVHDGTWITG